jgi:ABC-type glycerol-3-phosphate transport system substrate-binding protein
MVRATISTSQNPVFVEGWNPGIPVAAKEPDLAWKLMALWTSPEIQVMQSKTAGYLPMRKSAAAMVDPNSPDTAHVKPSRGSNSLFIAFGHLKA